MDEFESYSNLVAELKVRDIQRRIQQQTLNDIKQVKTEIRDKQLENETEKLEELEIKAKYLKDQLTNAKNLLLHQYRLKVSREIKDNKSQLLRKFEEQKFCNLFQKTERIKNLVNMFDKKFKDFYDQNNTSQAKKMHFLELKGSFDKLEKSAKFLEMKKFFQSLEPTKTRIEILSVENVESNSVNKSFALTNFSPTPLEPIEELTESIDFQSKASFEAMEISQEKPEPVFKTPTSVAPPTKSKSLKRPCQTVNRNLAPDEKRPKVPNTKSLIVDEPKKMETSPPGPSKETVVNESFKTDSLPVITADFDQDKEFDFDADFDFSTQKDMEFDFADFGNNYGNNSFSLDFSANNNAPKSGANQDDFELDFDLENF